LREILYFFPTIFTFWQLRKKIRDIDIIHINEITCILPLIIAKKYFKKPVVIHARAVFNNDPAKWRTRFIKKLFNKYADRIVAIDQTIANTIQLPEKLFVVHNSFGYDSLVSKSMDGFSRKLSQLPRRRLNIGYIGAIHHNKGIFDLLEAIKLCRDNDIDVNLIIAGNDNSPKTFWNGISKLLGLKQDRNEEMHAFIREHQLERFIHPLGFSTNTADYFKYIDVITFPTYYNSIGRPVFEAAFFKKPSIVAIRNPYSDTFIENTTGIRIEEKDPRSIFEAIVTFYNNPDLLTEMGNNAFALANTNFDVKKNAARILAIYKSLLPEDSLISFQRQVNY
jgi:glycosyltransferase involved in cell wall biosynthesis